MSPTHDLKRALQSAAETDRPEVDPADDLTRAVAAARARTRRRFRVGLAGLASAAVLTVGAVAVLDRAQPDPGAAADGGAFCEPDRSRRRRDLYSFARTRE